ncbi:cupin domain-containing protein [Verminephrobacter eiseniae]|uniref:cupin domain-containing protein n=1 Tax=Verminephrobacter eiseniae TaxID=364317 RepID=UPI002237CB3E|nr:cupin domain-containing protein [Verminephrobacter eiseniae]MCW5231898.1 cupin domain-containing protein [Verminephrobacter eiseniae]MCW5293631.1 cupin domain-containing protein [Verminephrobacter eiseniae]MCW8184288.1 cupin domain-containing protein [Verminephrobacter eiseniae]MCW8224027.1 cupin domain-containing protein [Verminephrobacter eiseniae]MCW8233303.1 cupin domain-containing protein [Verminephrobacter eiseniae]
MGKIPTIRVTREEMRKRVALFSQLKGSDSGLPDSRYPSAVRTLYNIIGFQPPEGDPDMHSPVGANCAENAAIKISEGFNLGMCETAPGRGPMMHNHDTNETFMPMTGRWRCSWEVDGRVEAFELGPRDVISFPAGVQRRFENITFEEPDATHWLLFVIGGDTPQAEFSPEAMAELRAKGYVDANGNF